LIGGLLFTEIKRRAHIDVGRFLMRRMLRIWPPYYILLVVVIVRMAWEPGGSVAAAWHQTWPAFVHIQNFIETPRSQLWSLAIEEHFYLMLPIFLWLITRKRSNPTLRQVPWACAFLSVLCLGIRSYFQLLRGFEVRAPMDALFFGVNLAYLHAYRPAVLVAFAKRWPQVLPVALLLFVPAFFAGNVRLTIGLTCVYLGYAAILVCFVYTPAGQWAQWRPVKWIAYVGTHSYSIYLWHRDTTWSAYELALELGQKLGLPGPVTWLLHTTAYTAAAVLGGIVLGIVIETPVQHIRERLFPSRIPSASALAR
jgi:peptidoglycan/LPS O-acetylase OafA/YrhL